MEYKGFSIKKNSSWLIIDDDRNSKYLWASRVYTDDENELFRIGKTVIDEAIEHCDSTEDNIRKSFWKMGVLDENNQLTQKYKPDPEGVKRKVHVRKEYTKRQIRQFGIDLLMVVALFCMMLWSNAETFDFGGWMILFSTVGTTLVLSYMAMYVALRDKDFYPLGSFGKIMAVISALILNKAPMSSYSGGIVSGINSRYVLLPMHTRMFCIFLIVSALPSVKPLTWIPAIAVLIIVALQIKADRKTRMLEKEYDNIDGNGVFKYEAPVW